MRLVTKRHRGYKIGPVFVARNSLVASLGGFAAGVTGRETLSGRPTGWALIAEAKPLNRGIHMDIDRPRVVRWSWK